MTIRELMEEQKQKHPEGDFYDSWCSQRSCQNCGSYWPCPEYLRAELVILVLDDASWHDDPSRSAMCRLVPDD